MVLGFRGSEGQSIVHPKSFTPSLRMNNAMRETVLIAALITTSITIIVVVIIRWALVHFYPFYLRVSL